MASHNGRLADKVVIVTGAAQGIGRTYALAMAQQGARVCVSDIVAPDETVEALRAHGAEVIGLRCDVTDQASVDAMVAAALKAFSRIDVLVNNAALFANLKMRSFLELDPMEWDRVMTVNVRGTWQVTKAVVPSMRASGGGSIINIASATVFKGSPMLAHYVASKGAVVALTRSLAREVGDANIRINALAPGLVMSEGVQDNAGWIESSKAIVASRAIKRDSQPEDMVGALLYLASDDSAFVTGQTLVVDGGSVMH
jgi:NAD(P)-dependent dehydrogenase (short-subunit alcohol dehydrogenase family)